MIGVTVSPWSKIDQDHQPDQAPQSLAVGDVHMLQAVGEVAPQVA